MALYNTPETGWTVYVSPVGLQYLVSVQDAHTFVFDLDAGGARPSSAWLDQTFSGLLKLGAGRATYWMSDENATPQKICHLTRKCYPAQGHLQGTLPVESVYWAFRKSHPDYMTATKQEFDVAKLILGIDCARLTLGNGTPQWKAGDSDAAAVLEQLERAEDGATRTFIVASVLQTAVDDVAYNHRLLQLKTDGLGHSTATSFTSFIFGLANVFPYFGTANLYLKRLQALQRTWSSSGNSIDKEEWHKYVKAIVKEWAETNLLAGVLIAATVSLLGVDDATESIKVALFLSILAGVGSVFVGLLYVWQHHTHTESSGEVGAVYLRRVESMSTFWFSLLLALPLLLLLWALIAFVLSVVLLLGGFKSAPDGSPDAEAQRVVSSVGILLFGCVVMSLTSFWSLWTHPLANVAAPEKTDGKVKRVILCLAYVLGTGGANAGFAYYVVQYIHAGTDPNPRIAPNKTHIAWTAFSAGIPLSGFALLFWNAFVLYKFFRSRFGFGRRSQQTHYLQQRANPYLQLGSTPVLTPLRLIPSWENVLRPRFIANVLLCIIAAIMTLGPFIIPFAALPMAQRWAWDHRCDHDSWNLTVLLQGRNSSSFSSATFQFKTGPGGEYSYDLRDGNSFVYHGTGLAAAAAPNLQNITYDLATSTVTGYCQSDQQHCLDGRMDQNLDSRSYLAFNITANLGPGIGNRTSYLQAVDHDWRYSNDAPSLFLRDQVTHRSVMRTVVTKRGDCTQLKMCANFVDEADLFVPVGRILIEQERWAQGSTCGSKARRVGPKINIFISSN